MRTKGLTIIAIIVLAFAWGQFDGGGVRAAEPPPQGVAKAPQTLAGVWTEILQQRQEMANLIDAKKLSIVEVPAFRIATLVQKLRGLSSMLPADKIATLKQLIAKVRQLGNDLDSTGDSNNLAGTVANAQKLDDVLQSIAALYPAGTLTDKPTSAPAATTSGSRLQ